MTDQLPMMTTTRIPTWCLTFAALLTAPRLMAQENRPDPNLEAAQRTLAILDQTADWKSLFNGENLDGWMGDTWFLLDSEPDSEPYLRF